MERVVECPYSVSPDLKAFYVYLELLSSNLYASLLWIVDDSPLCVSPHGAL